MRKSFHWTRPEDAPEEVRREIELHLELRAKEFEAQGMTPEAARRAALAAFGNRTQIEAEVEELRRSTVEEQRRRDRLGALRQDCRIALRGLRRAPGFTAVALLTLALGIGANSSIFSVVRSVLLRPLPYPDADRLVQLWSDHRARGRSEPEWLDPPQFLQWRDENRSFAAMAAYSGWGPDLTGSGAPVALGGVSVTGSWFRVLGTNPGLGRLLTEADDSPGAEAVVVLSDAVWRLRFGADPAVLGKAIQLNGESWTVVGVLPRDFRAPLPFTPEVYRAMRRPADSRCARSCIVWRAIGRLKPGVTLAQARQDLGAIASRQAAQYPDSYQNVGFWPVALHDQLTGPTRLPLLALSGAVAFVLLIACVNLANLLLVRGAARDRELGVRAALGAGRGRLLRQLLTESLVLALAGGALGLLTSLAGSRLLATLVPPAVRDVQSIRVDGVVVAFTGGLVLLSGLLFGLLPALHSARADLMGALRTAGRDSGRRSGVLKSGLVIAELGLAVVLLTGAGLLLKSFLLMQQVDLGYRTSGVVLVNVGFPRVRYPDAQRIELASTAILTALRAHPAIGAAEVTDLPPLSRGDQDVTAIPVGEPRRSGQPESIWYRGVSPGYHQVMQMRLVAGRQLSPDDRRGAARVGIINAEAAKRFWPGQNPVGRVLAFGEDSSAPRVTIVGLLGTTRQDGPNAPAKVELFMPISQSPSGNLTFVLEPRRDAALAAAAFREVLRQVDPLIPVAGEAPIEETVGAALALPRLYALLLSVFAGAALLLAVLGVYGVMTYVVSQRQREIGVRLALGASPLGIQRLVLGEGGKLALAGLAGGLLAAFLLSRLLGGLLFGVSPFDPETYLVVPLVLGGTSLLACWLPARRAMRVDPLVAIREE